MTGEPPICSFEKVPVEQAGRFGARYAVVSVSDGFGK